MVPAAAKLASTVPVLTTVPLPSIRTGALASASITSSTYTGAWNLSISSRVAGRPSRQSRYFEMSPRRRIDRMLMRRSAVSGCGSSISISGDASFSKQPRPGSCFNTSGCQNTASLLPATKITSGAIIGSRSM